MPVATHIADQNNPHQVDKVDVVLGNVENYLVASEVEAEAGTATDKYMTPLRVRDNLDKVLFDEGYIDGNGDPIIDQNFDWTSRASTTQAGSSLNGVARGNSVYVAVGTNQGDSNYSRLLSSTDGINWTNRPIEDIFIQSIAYGASLFVIVANGGNDLQTTDRRILTSPDGINWISRTNPAVSSAYSLGKTRFVNNRFIITAFNSGIPTQEIVTSTDGISWSLIDTLQSDFITDVSYGNGVYVFTTNVSKVITSTDLVTFTVHTLTNSDWRGITFDGTKFVMVGTGFTATSTDGITWSEVAAPNTNVWWDVAYSFGRYVAVASTPNLNNDKIMVSNDGVTWTLDLNPLIADVAYRGVVGFGNFFVIVGGSAGRIVSSQ